MLVSVIEILEMLVLVIKFRICIYEIITIHHLKNVTLLLRHIVFVVDDARPASSPSTRSRWRPALEDPCPGLGSAGLTLGGATFRDATLGEEPGPGSRRRPSSPLVAFVWDTFGAEGAGPAGGGTSPCQGGGRARPSLHGCVRGRQVLQYLAVSSGISLQLWSCEGSFSLGVHRPRRRNRECPRFFCSIRSLIS